MVGLFICGPVPTLQEPHRLIMCYVSELLVMHLHRGSRGCAVESIELMGFGSGPIVKSSSRNQPDVMIAVC